MTAWPDPMLPQPYRVDSALRELADTVTLRLTPVSGDCPSFECGQFNMLYAFGIGEIAISVSGDPGEPRSFVHTVREVGAVSRALCRAATGDTIGLRGPFGRGWPMREAAGADLIIVAGGLGLAPLRPVVLEVLSNRARYGRVFILVGCRGPSNLLFRKDLQSWRQRLDVNVDITVDHAGGDWRGNVGVVPDLIPRVHFDPDRAVAMVCGPELMMRFTVAALRAAGVADARIHLSMERNMKCAVGFCGRCQFGPSMLCQRGPVMRFDTIADIFAVRGV